MTPGLDSTMAFMRWRALAAIMIVFAAVIALIEYPRFERVEQRPAQHSFTDSVEVPDDIDTVSGAIQRTFNDGRELGFSPRLKFSAQDKFHYFYLFKRSAGVFPDDFQVRVHTHHDPALLRYSALPNDARGRDMYLYEPSGDYYWYSEFRVGRKPIKFHCAFIIHLAALDARRTRVEVLEYLPMVRTGKAFHLLGHAGPGFYYDIREVSPTAKDRAELVELIERSVRGRSADNRKDGAKFIGRSCTRETIDALI